MIQHVLPIVVDELNEYLKSKFNAIEDKALLSGIVDQDGSLAVETSNKIIATLVYIDRDNTTKGGPMNQFASGSFSEYAPPVNINLTIMFSALFNKNHYAEALRHISGVLYFFQQKPLFTASNTPKLSRHVEKVHFDLQSISPNDLMNIYSMLGAKYMPSVLYKMRMLTFSQETLISELPAVSGVGGKVR
jgi:hypothetical protein